MKCLAVCQDELIIRVLDEILLPSFEVEFLVENKALSKRLADDGIHITAGDLKRTDTYLKTNLTPNTCIIVEDNGRRSLRKALDALHDAGGTLIYVLGVGTGTVARNARTNSRPSSPTCRTSRWRSCLAARSARSSAVR